MVLGEKEKSYELEWYLLLNWWLMKVFGKVLYLVMVGLLLFKMVSY